FSSRRRHTRSKRDWSSDVCSSDLSRYILQYKLARGKGAPLEEQIAILKEYKSQEYTERWSYVLARLYAQAGMREACIEECDDLKIGRASCREKEERRASGEAWCKT